MFSISKPVGRFTRAARWALAMGLLGAGLAAIARPAHAQEDDSPVATRQLPSPDEVVDKLAGKLSLTDDQKAQIKPIIADRQEKLQDLRADTSMRRLQKRRKMRSIFQESDKKITSVLNDHQKKDYAEMKQQMRDEARERIQDRQNED